MISSKWNGLSMVAALALASCAYTDWRDSLSAADLAQMDTAVQEALETKKTGESGNWSEAASGHRGTVTPTRTWQSDDERDCRDYQQTVTVGDVTRVGYGSACRAENGAWVGRRSPRYVVAGAQPYRYQSHRLYFGFGYGHHFGHGHYGFGHHDFFGPYPLHPYRYGYPDYWY